MILNCLRVHTNKLVTQQCHQIAPICSQNACEHLGNKIKTTCLLSNGMHAVQQQKGYLISVTVLHVCKTHAI